MDGDSPGKEVEAYAQLLPRVSLEEVAMDFWATRGKRVGGPLLEYLLPGWLKS